MVSGFYFLRDLLTIRFVPEDSRFLMGGSDVVHCARVPLTDTNVAESGRVGVWLGLFYVQLPTLCTILWTLRAPLLLLFNGHMS